MLPLPEMTLLSPGWLPPMMLPLAPLSDHDAAADVADRRGACGVHADVVAPYDVPVAVAPPMRMPTPLLPEMMFRAATVAPPTCYLQRR